MVTELGFESTPPKRLENANLVGCPTYSRHDIKVEIEEKTENIFYGTIFSGSLHLREMPSNQSSTGSTKFHKLRFKNRSLQKMFFMRHQLEWLFKPSDTKPSVPEIAGFKLYDFTILWFYDLMATIRSWIEFYDLSILRFDNHHSFMDHTIR